MIETQKRNELIGRNDEVDMGKKMNIEFVEFYLRHRNIKRQHVSGTVRVNLPDIGLSFLGIYVSKTKDFWYIDLPSGRGDDPVTGEDVRYPYVSFSDKERQKEFMEALREQVPNFVETKLVAIDAAIMEKKRLSRMDSLASVADGSKNEEVVINEN